MTRAMPTPVCPSVDLSVGAVVGAEVGADDIVVWRDGRGRAHAHEARCPHLFNHLAAVGAVDGDELVCTAHFWRFDAAGTGSRRLSNGRRETVRDLARYPCWEADGSVWVAAGPSDAAGGA